MARDPGHEQRAAMKRFFVSTPLLPGAKIRLSPEESKHATKVMRLAVGDFVLLTDGRGIEARAELLNASKDGAELEIHSVRNADQRPFRLELFQGILKGARMDWLIEKATELGVARITPLVTQRTVLRLSGERADKKRAHWQDIAASACEQCGRNRLPEIAPVQNVLEFTRLQREGTKLLLSPRGKARLKSLTPDQRVTLLIGAEGGLSPEEHDDALRAGFSELCFGPRVLRTETAPLAVIAALQATWGDC